MVYPVSVQFESTNRKNVSLVDGKVTLAVPDHFYHLARRQ